MFAINEENKIICAKCGAVLNEDYQFRPSCGTTAGKNSKNAIGSDPKVIVLSTINAAASVVFYTGSNEEQTRKIVSSLKDR